MLQMLLPHRDRFVLISKVAIALTLLVQIERLIL